MIARLWTARTTPARVAEYLDHFQTRVAPQLRAMEGYNGATLLTRADGIGVEIIVITRWKSLETIRAFTGDDVDRAVVAPEAEAILTRWDQRVRHYDVPVNHETSS